ncbi:MAG: O-acetylhomoserine aminocarboxypropyltransferase/cysteine synthase [Phycisphaerae bacterium]|nr:O-acetylhomoserine aminocarboxypropyltransferase/cysteine synthase [Phycisphaerae bacterium]
MNEQTRAIHDAWEHPDATGATATPIYQTAAYAHTTAQELADVFAGRAPGYTYTRVGNPTTAALERRMADLEEGVGAVATASGMAAITAVAVALLRAGDEIVAAKGVFGGTVSLFEKTLARFGITTHFADVAHTEEFAAAVSPSTRFIFVETIGNPRMDVPDLTGIAAVAQAAGVPFVVDSTATTPMLARAGAHGADIVIHSTSKFINGHGTAIGGCIVDTGHFDWARGPFEDVRQWGERAGPMAFLAYLRNLIYRDLGGCPAPMNSFLMLQGLETLAPRMAIHCDNAARLAEWLGGHKAVQWVSYPGRAESPFYERVKAQYGGRGGGLLTFGLGSRQNAFRFIDALRLAKNVANIGDVRTLVIHPASTIFHEFNADARADMGIAEDMVRVSVGLEHTDDIVMDFQDALEKAFEVQR